MEPIKNQMLGLAKKTIEKASF